MTLFLYYFSGIALLTVAGFLFDFLARRDARRQHGPSK
jgi:hypothetical protein